MPGGLSRRQQPLRLHPLLHLQVFLLFTAALLLSSGWKVAAQECPGCVTEAPGSCSWYSDCLGDCQPAECRSAGPDALASQLATVFCPELQARMEDSGWVESLQLCLQRELKPFLRPGGDDDPTVCTETWEHFLELLPHCLARPGHRLPLSSSHDPLLESRSLSLCELDPPQSDRESWKHILDAMAALSTLELRSSFMRSALDQMNRCEPDFVAYTSFRLHAPGVDWNDTMILELRMEITDLLGVDLQQFWFVSPPPQGRRGSESLEFAIFRPTAQDPSAMSVMQELEDRYRTRALRRLNGFRILHLQSCRGTCSTQEAGDSRVLTYYVALLVGVGLSMLLGVMFHWQRRYQNRYFGPAPPYHVYLWLLILNLTLCSGLGMLLAFSEAFKYDGVFRSREYGEFQLLMISQWIILGVTLCYLLHEAYLCHRGRNPDPSFPAITAHMDFFLGLLSFVGGTLGIQKCRDTSQPGSDLLVCEAGRDASHSDRIAILAAILAQVTGVLLLILSFQLSLNRWYEAVLPRIQGRVAVTREAGRPGGGGGRGGGGGGHGDEGVVGGGGGLERSKNLSVHSMVEISRHRLQQSPAAFLLSSHHDHHRHHRGRGQCSPRLQALSSVLLRTLSLGLSLGVIGSVASMEFTADEGWEPRHPFQWSDFGVFQCALLTGVYLSLWHLLHGVSGLVSEFLNPEGYARSGLIVLTSISIPLLLWLELLGVLLPLTVGILVLQRLTAELPSWHQWSVRDLSTGEGTAAVICLLLLPLTGFASLLLLRTRFRKLDSRLQDQAFFIQGRGVTGFRKSLSHAQQLHHFSSSSSSSQSGGGSGAGLSSPLSETDRKRLARQSGSLRNAPSDLSVSAGGAGGGGAGGGGATPRAAGRGNDQLIRSPSGNSLATSGPSVIGNGGAAPPGADVSYVVPILRRLEDLFHLLDREHRSVEDVHTAAVQSQVSVLFPRCSVWILSLVAWILIVNLEHPTSFSDGDLENTVSELRLLLGVGIALWIWSTLAPLWELWELRRFRKLSQEHEERHQRQQQEQQTHSNHTTSVSQAELPSLLLELSVYFRAYLTMLLDGTVGVLLLIAASFGLSYCSVERESFTKTLCGGEEDSGPEIYAASGLLLAGFLPQLLLFSVSFLHWVRTSLHPPHPVVLEAASLHEAFSRMPPPPQAYSRYQSRVPSRRNTLPGGGGGIGGISPILAPYHHPAALRCQALYDFEAMYENELSFQAGDILVVTLMDGEWFEAFHEENPDYIGIVPSNYLAPI